MNRKLMIPLVLLIVLISIAAGKIKSVPAAIPEDPEVFAPSANQNPLCPFYKNEKSSVFSIVAVGDLMLSGRLESVLRQQGVDYPFDHTGPILKSADLSIVNLESPFGKGGDPFEKKFTFKVSSEYAECLPRQGIDLATLANNHILDFGSGVLQQTLDVLDSLKVHHCGAGMNRDEAECGALYEKDGWKVASFAFSLTYPEEFWARKNRPGTAYPVKQRMIAAIEAIRGSVDLVTVSFHWGGEGLNYPKWYQKFFGHAAIDAGADLVIGHHPHVLQGFEIYKDKLIAYSLGNYIFGSYSTKSIESVILKIHFDQKGSLLAELIPISVNNYEVEFQPKVMEGERRVQVLDHINEYSKEFSKDGPMVISSGLILFNKEKQ